MTAHYIPHTHYNDSIMLLTPHKNPNKLDGPMAFYLEFFPFLEHRCLLHNPSQLTLVEQLGGALRLSIYTCNMLRAGAYRLKIISAAPMKSSLINFSFIIF